MSVFHRIAGTSLMVLMVIQSALALKAQALPRYAARYDQKCGLCHVNPTGGGIRTAYASQYLVPKELAWSQPRPELLRRIQPHIADNILLGADLRELYAASNLRAQTTDFFLMQGNVDFAFQMDEKLQLYFERGMTNTYEVYGLAYVLPLTGGYVKLGRFAPPYGWRFDDHTMFVRSALGFSPPGHTDVGVEVGASPGRLSLAAAAVNGNQGRTLDNNANLAFSGTGSVRFTAAGLHGALGASGLHDREDTRTFDALGAFGYLSLRGITWLGEADRLRERTAGIVTTGLVTSHELSCRLHKGLDLKGTYDFHDPDTELTSGTQTRWGAGLAVMPNSFLTVEALYRHTTFENGSALAGRDFDQGIVQVHFMY